MIKNHLSEDDLMTREIAQGPTCNEKAVDSNLKLTITSGCWGLGVFPELFANSDLSAMRMITLMKKKKKIAYLKSKVT